MPRRSCATLLEGCKPSSPELYCQRIRKMPIFKESWSWLCLHWPITHIHVRLCMVANSMKFSAPASIVTLTGPVTLPGASQRVWCPQAISTHAGKVKFSSSFPPFNLLSALTQHAFTCTFGSQYEVHAAIHFRQASRSFPLQLMTPYARMNCKTSLLGHARDIGYWP
jgi:hypothetical protein